MWKSPNKREFLLFNKKLLINIVVVLISYIVHDTDKKFFCKSFGKTDICIINGIMDYIFYFLENVLAHSVLSQDANDEVCLTLLNTLFY